MQHAFRIFDHLAERRDAGTHNETELTEPFHFHLPIKTFIDERTKQTIVEACCCKLIPGGKFRTEQSDLGEQLFAMVLTNGG